MLKEVDEPASALCSNENRLYDDRLAEENPLNFHLEWNRVESTSLDSNSLLNRACHEDFNEEFKLI